MTSIALLASLLAGGWFFYRQWRFTRFEALHHPGHPQYFGAGLCAVYIFVLGAGVHFLSVGLPQYEDVVKSVLSRLPINTVGKQSADHLAAHLSMTVWALLLAATAPLLLNSPLVNSRRLAQIVAYRNGGIDQLESLAILCEEQQLLCGLTLENGKFYAGILEEFAGPHIGKEWIALTPIASGYRDDACALSLTTFYDISSAKQRNIFRIVVSTKQIISAQSFDLRLYKEFVSAAEDFNVRENQGASEGGVIYPPQGSLGGKIDDVRYFLYLSLPISLLIAPFAALIFGGLVGGAVFLFGVTLARLSQAFFETSWRPFLFLYTVFFVVAAALFFGWYFGIITLIVIVLIILKISISVDRQ